MRVWGWRSVLGLVLASLLAAGTATAALMTTLVVTVLNPIADAPVYVAEARDIFTRYGLAVRIVPATPGFGPLQRVVDGTAQVGVAAPAQVALARAQGANLKSIFAAHGDATGRVPADALFAVVARKTSGIREGHLEDLRGKKIGLAAGSDAHKYLFYALTAKGLDPVRDVTIVSTPPAGLPGALQSGSVGAIVILEPTASIAVQSTPDTVVVQRGGNYTQLLTLEVVASRYLATHPGTMNRYAAAFAEAAKYLRGHRTETADLLTRNIIGVTPTSLRNAVGIASPDMRVSKVTIEAAQQSYDFAIKIGLLKQAPTFEEMFDLRVLRQVEREHPELFADLTPVSEVP